ncbi:GPI-GlcNAc transferase complex, PIG-H component-domain-containing protein [Hypoxylon rubiginosum]|uniref:GPI-GlcNAc transferase complex, PIG-H component-domain-containing protein n=1 Tax=Hypoxylon rubiginosum TaxID=110542 RepID=A0ACB9ZGW8_9PEZI|nr:GPI-GlcNAc transferase complex, PIG-H component-domain-containing protein [Hypoxylon rubiginosum]
MLTTAPYLRTRRPSPTTAEFIVSTLPPMTIPLRLALGAVYLLRLVAALGILLLLFSAWAQSPYSSSNASLSSTSPDALDDDSPPPLLSLAFIQQLLFLILSTRPGSLFPPLASALPPWLLVPASAFALYSLSLRIGSEERLLVLRGLGVQTSTGGRTVFHPLQTRFIPTERVADVLVNEAFRGFGVRHYLVVVVRGGEDRLVVVFPELLPRLDDVARVLEGARACLYGGGGGGGGGGEEKGGGRFERRSIA